MQVPQRLYSLDELKLNGIEASSLLSPKDTTLGAIERNLQLAALLGAISVWNVFRFDPQAALYLSLGVLFLWTLDLVNSLICPSYYAFLTFFILKTCCIMGNMDTLSVPN